MPTVRDVARIRTALNSAGYLPVPVRTNGKAPIEKDWPEKARNGECPDNPFALNTGVLCDGLRPIDVDVDNPDLASAIIELAFEMLGEAPVKYRANSARRTLVYRAADGQPRKKSVISRSVKNEDDKMAKVEVLGLGQQFVAFGIHPSGAELQWTDRPLFETPRDDLAPVTEDRIAEFLSAVAEKIDATSSPDRKEPPRPARVERIDHPDARIKAYCDAAIAAELDEFRSAPKGTRNDKLNEAAFTLGQLVGANWVSESEVADLLERAAEESGYMADDGISQVRKTIQSGLAAGRRQPRELPERDHAPVDDGYDPNVLLRGFLAKRAAEEMPPADFLIPASSFAGRATPTREFLDDRQLIPMRNVTMLSGDGGTGKSLIAMQLAAAVSTGTPFLGRRVKLGPVVYFSAEDDEAETHIRLKEICEADGLDLSVMHELGIAVMAGRDAVLAAEEVRLARMKETPLWRTLMHCVSAERPALVILDNLADIFAGNENSRPLARQFVGMLRGMAMEIGCAVVLLSHPSVAGMSSGTGTSGNTAWSNSVRSRLYLRRDYTASDDRAEEVDPNVRVLETKKANYGQIGGELRVRWEGGRFVNVDEPKGEASGDLMAQTLKAERIFMHLLRWHLRHDKFVSPNKSVSYAPKVFAAHHQSEGMRATQFERAMAVLLEHNQIMIYTHGSPANRRQHIGLPIGQYLDEERST